MCIRLCELCSSRDGSIEVRRYDGRIDAVGVVVVVLTKLPLINAVAGTTWDHIYSEELLIEAHWIYISLLQEFWSSIDPSDSA